MIFEKAGANKVVYEDDEVAVHQVFRTGMFRGFWLRWARGVYANSLEGAKIKVWILMQHYEIGRDRPRRYHRGKLIGGQDGNTLDS